MKLVRGLLKVLTAAGYGFFVYGVMSELNSSVMAVPPYWTRHQSKQDPMNGSARVIIATSSAYGVWSALGKFGGWFSRRAHRKTWSLK